MSRSCVWGLIEVLVRTYTVRPNNHSKWEARNHHGGAGYERDAVQIRHASELE